MSQPPAAPSRDEGVIVMFSNAEEARILGVPRALGDAMRCVRVAFQGLGSRDEPGG